MYMFIKVFHQSLSFVPSVTEPMNCYKYFTGIVLYLLHKKIDIVVYSTLQAFSNPIYFQKIKTTCNDCEKIISTLKTITVPKSVLRFFSVLFLLCTFDFF